MLTPEEIEQLELERVSKVVDINQVIDSVRNIYINRKSLDEIMYTMDEYIDYLELLESLPKDNLKYFLDALKTEEILVTQFVEPTDSKQIVANMLNPDIRKDSVDYIHSKMLNQRYLTQRNIKFAHQIVITGSADDEAQNKCYRTEDGLWVGGWVNGKPNIQYAPPFPEHIAKNMKRIINLINTEEYRKTELDCFVHPIIIHALISILQPFYDGNTRLSRLVQSSQFLLNTNEFYNKAYMSPILALSREYYGLSANYRTLIAKIAMNPCSENWNAWLLFNLRNIQSNIEYCKIKIYQNQLDKVKER